MSHVIIRGHDGYARLASSRPTSRSSSTQSQRQRSFKSKGDETVDHLGSHVYHRCYDNAGKKIAQ